MTHFKPPIRDAKQKAYLEVLAQTGIIKAACEATPVDRSTVSRWRKTVDGFAEAEQEALESAADDLESEARRRAVEGFEEPVFYKGEVAGHVRKHSDYLLGLLLKANRPDKFRENVKMDLNAKVQLNQMSDEEIKAELAALAAAGIVPAESEPDDYSDLA